jgi:ATP-binding cassette subfamily B protein
MEDFELDEEIKDMDYHSKEKGPWKKIIKTVLKNKKLVIGLLCANTFATLMDIFYPLINSYAITNFFESTDPNRFDSVWIFITFYIVAAIINGFLIWAFLFFAGRIEIKTSYELRKEAYLNLQKLPFSYFDQTAQGWIMARLTSDARKLSEIISWGVVDLMWGTLTMIGILIVLLVYNPLLALVVICVLPIVFVVVTIIRKKK